MKRILITGAGPNGFVGRNLKEILTDKYIIFAPSSKELDLCDYERVNRYIDENRIEVIIHSAVHNPRTKGNADEIENNLKMYYNLEKISSSLNKMLYFGSGAEFGKNNSIYMVKEEEFGKIIPTDPYGFTKYIMNKNARKAANIFNLRLFGIFGKYEYWQLKFISNLCCKAVFDLELTIRQNCWFDFLYINDLPSIVEWFIENKPLYNDYNICYGTPVDLVSLGKIVREVSGKKLDINVLKEGYNLSYTGDNNRLRKEISTLKLTDYIDSISDLYKFYYDNKQNIDYDELKLTK